MITKITGHTIDEYVFLRDIDTTNYPLLCFFGAIIVASIILLVYLFKYAKNGERDDMNMVRWRKRIGMPLSLALLLGITVLSIYICYELRHHCLVGVIISLGTIFLFCAAFCGTYFTDLNDKAHKMAIAKAEAAGQAEQKENFDRQLAESDAKYGEHTAIINYGKWCNFNDQMIVYEAAQILIIKSVEYRFIDILGYSLIDDVTNETITTAMGTAKTSTGSMLGRAAIGGVLTGALGAVAGAVTAKKNISGDITTQSTSTHSYTLYVSVNSLLKPSIALKIGNNSSLAQRLAGLIKAIIERNKQISQ